VSVLVQNVYQAIDTESTLNLLNQHQGDAKILAGGTDLIIQMREGNVSPPVLIDISSIIETREIKEQNNTIELGSTATFTDIENHALFSNGLSAIANAARSIGSPQIRNRATVGGNICNASPAADMLPPLLAMDAMVVLKSQQQTRVLPLSEFVTGKEKTLLKVDELLEKIRFQALNLNAGLGFSKLGVRNALAIARLSMAVYVERDANGICQNIRIASGALGLMAQREWDVETFMKGKCLNSSLFGDVSAFLEESTMKRLAGRSTMNFKRYAVQGVFRQALDEALESSERRKTHEKNSF
jgi:CO/xanthine dehydrogenase FAD-binding subunit